MASMSHCHMSSLEQLLTIIIIFKPWTCITTLSIKVDEIFSFYFIDLCLLRPADSLTFLSLRSVDCSYHVVALEVTETLSEVITGIAGIETDGGQEDKSCESGGAGKTTTFCK